jgi:GNAT superfamily N-acetyltransferase
MGIERFDLAKHREDVLRLGELMEKEGHFPAWDSDRVFQIIQNPNVYAILYRNGTGRCIGMLAGHIGAPWFSTVPIAKDLAWYVEPEHRGGMAAVRMIRAFESWAKEQGAGEVWLAQSSGVSIERTRKFSEALGYITVGFLTRRSV